MFLQYAGNPSDVLASNRGPSCSRIEQLKGEKFWSGFLRISNHIVKMENVPKCEKRSSTPCKTPPKVIPTPTKYVASISVKDIL